MAKNKKKRIKWKILILSLLISYLVEIIGWFFTSLNVNSQWYRYIKPLITPPNWVFPIVWNILFFLIGISLYINWTKGDRKQRNNIIFFFGINFVLNIAWTILFFAMKNVLIAFFEILILLISILAMINISYKVDKKAAYLLIPYLLWVCFAAVLNLWIMVVG